LNTQSAEEPQSSTLIANPWLTIFTAKKADGYDLSRFISGPEMFTDVIHDQARAAVLLPPRLEA
jgi:hypothetical protein